MCSTSSRRSSSSGRTSVWSGAGRPPNNMLPLHLPLEGTDYIEWTPQVQHDAASSVHGDGENGRDLAASPGSRDCCTESLRAPRPLTTSSPLKPKKVCARMIRRQEWLAATAPPEEGGDPEAATASPRASTADKYGVDLEEFKMKSSRKPRDFKKFLRIS